MGLLKNVLCGVAVSMGVVGVMAVSAPPVRADFPHLQASASRYPTQAAAAEARLNGLVMVGGRTTYVTYLQFGSAGAGWYICLGPR